MNVTYVKLLRNYKQSLQGSRLNPLSRSRILKIDSGNSPVRMRRKSSGCRIMSNDSRRPCRRQTLRSLIAKLTLMLE